MELESKFLLIGQCHMQNIMMQRTANENAACLRKREAIVGFQFGLYHVVVPLSFLFSINLASLFAILSIFGWSDLLQILRK